MVILKTLQAIGYREGIKVMVYTERVAIKEVGEHVLTLAETTSQPSLYLPMHLSTWSTIKESRKVNEAK